MKLRAERGSKQEYVDDDTGKRYFSVSQIRQQVYDGTVMVPSDVLETARARGTVLHQRFWRVLAARVKLVEPPAIIPGLEGFCAAQDSWAEKNKVEPIDLETKVVNEKLGYAGQEDATIYYGIQSWKVLMDLKTGQRSPTDIMQLLAYEAALPTRYLHMLDLYIFANGSYHEEWVSMKEKLTHWPAFLNALSLLRWRLTNV